MIVSCTINPLKQERITRAHPDDGFVIFSFQGNILCQIRKERLFQFEWRPRPRDLLNQEDKKKIIKNLKKYERLFEKEDRLRKEELDQELYAHRRRTATEFLMMVQHNKRVNAGLKMKRVIARNGYDSDDESNYMIEISVCIYI
jgi:translation initiation factor 3 subunit B